MQPETESKPELELLYSLDMFIKHQKNQAQIISSLDHKTNKLLVKNTKNTIKQSEMIAKITSKSSIKSRTLEKSWHTIKSGINKIRCIHENSFMQLKEEQAKLQVIKNDFNKRYSMPKSNN